jgi:hypothetical protein
MVAMSALPPKADIRCHDRHVRFVPKADVCSAAKKHGYSITSCQKGTNCSAASFEGNKNSIAAVSSPRGASK